MTDWSQTDKVTQITVSAGDKLASVNSGGAYRGVRGTTSKSSGKWLVTMTPIFTSAQTQIGLGFANASASLTSYAGIDNNSLAFYDLSGVIGFYTGDASPFSWTGSFVTGQPVDFAIDLDNKLVWASYNGGDWNGNAAYTPDVGSQAGGQDISTFLTGAPAVFPFATPNAADHQVRVSLRGSSLKAMPVGFAAWDARTRLGSRGMRKAA